MAVVRTLTADTDEINVALWSPLPGGGIVYGTKQGRLRLLRLDKQPPEPKGGGGTSSSGSEGPLADPSRVLDGMAVGLPPLPGSSDEEDEFFDAMG
jgi:hypothetical protein